MNEELVKRIGGVDWPIEDDFLMVGGMSILKLAAQVGSTPFYAYDRRILAERVALLRKHLPPEIKLHYAVKANPMRAVVEFMAQHVDGLDVASGRELAVALGAGANPSEISFAGPGKSIAELEQAVAAGILLNIESAREVRELARVRDRLGKPPRTAVRINPAFELKSSGMKMGGGAKQFGVDAEQVPALLNELERLDLGFEGFHIYSGSQNLRAEAICESQRRSLELAAELAAHAYRPVRVVNIGGGFGVPYFPGEQPLDLSSIGINLASLVVEAKRALPEAHLVVELGRFLVAEAGIYVCTVIDRKVSRGQVFLVTDGGLHQHLAASGNFGQVVRKNYPVVVGNKVKGRRREIASVVGPLCTPLDLLADRMEMAEAEEGDLVVVFQSGAYGLTASPIHFLSHPEPREVVV